MYNSGLYFQYDGERNLKSIHRSDSLDYRLELSPDGLLTQTQGFDGIKQHYQYDISGRISELQSGNRAVKITYNAHGDIASRSKGKQGMLSMSVIFSIAMEVNFFMHQMNRRA